MGFIRIYDGIPSGKQFAIENGLFMFDLPMNNGDFPWLCKRLPEGMENPDFPWVYQLFLWPFSIANC